MRRRTSLLLLAGVLIAALAGCAVIRGISALPLPTAERDLMLTCVKA